MTIDFKAEARAISEYLVKQHPEYDGLGLLDNEEILLLAGELEKIASPEQEARFIEMFQGPPLPRVNRELKRILRAIHDLAEISESEDPASMEAKAQLFNLPSPSLKVSPEHQRVLDWLAFAPTMAAYYPNRNFQSSGTVASKPSRIPYRTFMIGHLLPELFKTLYPGVRFGYQKSGGPYQGAGVSFVIDCMDSLKMGEITGDGVRAAQRSLVGSTALKFYSGGKGEQS